MDLVFSWIENFIFPHSILLLVSLYNQTLGNEKQITLTLNQKCIISSAYCFTAIFGGKSVAIFQASIILSSGSLYETVICETTILIVCRKTVTKLTARKVKKNSIWYLISIFILILYCFKLLTLFNFPSTDFPVCTQSEFWGRGMSVCQGYARSVELSESWGKCPVHAATCQHSC